MIPKLICFIFGHKRTWKEFSGEYGEKYNGLSQRQITVPIMIERKREECPRCGADLKGKV